MKLYEHQVECAEAVERQFAGGSNRTLAVLATGAGKTIIYLHLVDKWVKEGKRILILAHRRELIHQPIERAAEFYPELASKMGIVMAEKDDSDAQVVVATIQTVARDDTRLALQQFDYVVLDEAHHGTAATYMKMVDKFPGAKWLGLTATPFRTDGDSLSKVFDSLAYRYTIDMAVGRTLVPFDAYGFTLPISVEGLDETEDGWESESLGDLLSAGNVLEIVYEKWLEYCKDRRTICFTASVKQAHATAAYFNQMGVKASSVDGSTAKKQRDQILKKFRSGELQVVANCQVWTEGVDVPEASAALMVCPTKSDLAYVQKLGRILRTAPNKTNAVILDFAPLEDRNIVMAGDVLGVPRMITKAEAKAKEGGVLVGVTRVDDYGMVTSVDPVDIVVQALQYLRKGSLAWAFQESLAVASVSNDHMVAIEIPNLDRIAKAEALRKSANKWTTGMENLYKSLLRHRLWFCIKVGNFWVAKFIDEFDGMEKAMEVGNFLGEKYYMPALAKKRRQWRNRPASDAQIGYMRRLEIQIPEGCNSGQAAQLISYKIASNTIAKLRPVIERNIMNGKEEAKNG